MAPGKRSRNVDDVDGEVEVESASSNFRQHNPKRSRVALARENGGSVVSDDDEEVDSYMGEGAYTADASADQSEKGDDDIDELRATQMVEKQFREHRENIAMDQGVIEEVYCRNFMCHAKLRIKLGPLINFIIGHNGSGKSAVLTALTMCLGGKATATNRGASLKSLIKEGEESATLAVKIKNQGDGAYKPELYGDSITVERHFTRGGTSGFKIKNWSDKVITTKKADLDDILDFFAFQLDNPINVLTQDMARQFLSNSSPADKYKFFIRGTQLEMLDADYQLLEEHLDSMEAKLNSRKQDISMLKQKEEEAERKKKRLEQTRATRERIDQLQWMHAWLQVEEQEAILEGHERSVQEAEQHVQERTDAAQNSEGAYEGHNQAWEAARRSVHDFEEQLPPLQEVRDAEKEKQDINKQSLLGVKAQERQMRENITSFKKKIKDLGKDITDEKDRLAGAEGAEHTDRLNRLEELQEAADEKKREQMEHGTRYAELERKKNDAIQKHDDGKPRLNQLREGQRKAEQKLQNTMQQQPRPYAGYRPNMDKLVNAINRETRWRSKPVGPLGKHVKLLRTEWSSQLEKTFGGTLDGFVVTCKEDQNLLSQIMRKVDCSPGIFIGSSTRLDTTGKEPDGVDTILKILEIDNDAVRNQLIINQAIEQSVLIADQHRAMEYLEQSPRPQNVKSILAIHGTDRKRGIRYEWSKGGGQKSSPIFAWDGDSRMKSNREDQIRAQREDVDQAKREVASAEQDVRQLATAAKEAQQEVARFKRRQQELTVEVQEAEDAVQDQQEDIEKHRPQDGKLQALQEQLESAKGDLEAEESSFQDMVLEKDNYNKLATEIKARLDVAQAELDQAQDRVNRAVERRDQAENARRQALADKNMALANIDSAKNEQTRLEGLRDKQKQTVGEFEEMANKVSHGHRIPVEEGITTNVIDKRLDKLMADVQRAEKEAGGTREELIAAWLQAKHEYEEAEAQMKGMNKCAETLKKTLAERHYRWKMFRKYISVRARCMFGYLLSERQFRGRILMSHADKELDIKVEPDLSKTSDAGRATRTLSGGEKSFSTICLLLSIWEAMGSPIRCLDEFDVFMDSVNRATSMSMMIKAARRSVGRQFILITPQSMNNVDLGDDVRVHKMNDPERGQTTLPFGGTQT